RTLFGLANSARVGATVIAMLVGFTGCETPQFTELNRPNAAKPDAIVLHEGDVLRISFPGAPNLNTTQTIRRDGRITLQLVGEFQAAGMNPSQMEKELIKLYGPQLQAK